MIDQQSNVMGEMKDREGDQESQNVNGNALFVSTFHMRGRAILRPTSTPSSVGVVRPRSPDHLVGGVCLSIVAMLPSDDAGTKAVQQNTETLGVMSQARTTNNEPLHSLSPENEVLRWTCSIVRARRCRVAWRRACRAGLGRTADQHNNRGGRRPRR